ncbi:WD40 repeat-like protein [Suillus decipiens]|nr:WD40 repeat-like protein [Suillus decipiens]
MHRKVQGTHSAFNGAYNTSLAWTLDGKQLIYAGDYDPTIRIWDSSTWKQVGEPCKGHSNNVRMIALSPAGTLLASASDDCQVRVWRLSDQRTFAIFKHSSLAFCVTFSKDGKHILSRGIDNIISKWAVSLLEDALTDQVLSDASRKDTPKEQVANNAQQSDIEILTIDKTARNACITGDLPTADRLLTQEINSDGNDYNSYANHSFVMARKADWDRAFDDALKVRSTVLSRPI